MPEWTKDQERAFSYRGGELLVSAAAGSGKTAVLVQRILSRLTDEERPEDISRFLVVTFTNAAAADMKDKIRAEIKALKEICGDKILKVIIETCLLTEDEKLRMCKIVTAAGADYIKTSTGFSTAGATLEDVKLMRANVGKNVCVKAAGGISGLEDAENFLQNGADRLGTSRVVKAVQGIEGKGY